MPARTLPSADRAPTSRQQRHSTSFTASSALLHRDIHDERLQRIHVLYDMTVPPLMAHHNQHNPYPAPDHRYPTSFIPPPLQVQHFPVSPPGSSPPFVSYPGPPPAPVHANSYPGGSIPPAAWRAPAHAMFRQPPAAPPPPIPHKVWILDCKSCNKFLTNRGMKAVLLLRPNVPLYSTDAMPINCSAFSDSSESMAGSSVMSPPLSAGSHSSGSSSTDGERLRTLARTCECLTQTLHCHGCGNGVGYMIVSPCHRCMSSITATNRSTNGHRFVFYSSEIAASERHYVAGEDGVRPYIIPIPSPPLSAAPQPPGASYMPMHHATAHPLEFPPGTSEHEYLPHSRRSSTSSGSRSSASPIEFARPSSEAMRSSQHRALSPPRPPARASAPPHPLTARDADGGYSSSPAESSSNSGSSSLTVERYPEPIQPGEVVYWHHLIRSGELPAVVEDPRARGPPVAAADNDKSSIAGSQSRSRAPKHVTVSSTRGVFAGR